MNLWIGALLAIGAGIGIAAAWREPRLRTLLITVQIASVVLLYLVLLPPRTLAPGQTLALLTPGASPAQIVAARAYPRLAALPDATADVATARVPDLATALRRDPEVRSLRVIGAGLPSRDRDAARTLALEFDAAPLPRGLIELHAPTLATVGNPWRIGGRVNDVAGGRVELLDPAGGVAAQAELDNDGRFLVQAFAKSANEALFILRVTDHTGASVEEVSVPLSTIAATPLQLVVLTGGVDPESKYLRRWIVDAGMHLSARSLLGAGIEVRDGSPALDAAALQTVDLAIVDDRAWATLAVAEKDALIEASNAGMGLLLRATGPLPRAFRDDLERLGVPLREENLAMSIRLAPFNTEQSSEIQLSRLALRGDADDAVPLVAAQDGPATAVWRARGRGRIAVSWLLDSYRLALSGDKPGYSSLWSSMVATLARARETGRPEVTTPLRIDERAVLCGLAAPASVIDPAGDSSELLPDAASCAAYWPMQAGWHRLRSEGRDLRFYVRTAGAAPGLQAAERRDATEQLVNPGAAQELAASTMPRWPLFLAWLAVNGWLWWLERKSARRSLPEPA